MLTTTIWSDVLFGDTPAWIRGLADARTYDLYLVLDVDVSWVSDRQRFFSEQPVRKQMFERFLSALQSRGRPFRIIRGNWKERFANACEAVEELLNSR